MESSQAAELLVRKIADTGSNAEFLLQVQNTALGPSRR